MLVVPCERWPQIIMVSNHIDSMSWDPASQLKSCESVPDTRPILSPIQCTPSARDPMVSAPTTKSRTRSATNCRPLSAPLLQHQNPIPHVLGTRAINHSRKKLKNKKQIRQLARDALFFSLIKNSSGNIRVNGNKAFPIFRRPPRSRDHINLNKTFLI